MDQDPILPGRSCGNCTLCCKLMGIDELEKPRGQWCRHCNVGMGCGIYGERPPVCRDFYCGYLTWPMAGDHWFPARSKMVLASELDGARLVIHVDPGRPDAWRDPPYYADLKRWAALAARDLRQVVVSIGQRSIVVLPNEDVDLGFVSADERIVMSEIYENGRPKLRALKLRADDPRLTGTQTGAIQVAR